MVACSLASGIITYLMTDTISRSSLNPSGEASTSKLDANKLSSTWQGVMWKILSCACFAAINGIVRYLSKEHSSGLSTPMPATVIGFYQNIFALCLIIPWLLNRSIPIIPTQFRAVHLFRVSMAVCGVCLWFSALSFMPIAEVVALSFMGPVFTLIGATMVLHEKLTPYKIIAIAASFIGVFLITRLIRLLFRLKIKVGSCCYP
jgi:drug/metabolite transporter (DMT)-like permease